MSECLSVSYTTTKQEGRSIARLEICAAASRGHTQEVQRLLDQGADVNAYSNSGQSALQIAAEEGHASVVRLLTKAGADANAQGGYYANALQAAIHSEEEEVVQILLNSGADVNAQGGPYGNALQAAVVSRMKNVVQALLEMGVDVNSQGGYYGNALQAAATLQMEEVIQWLLKRGADVNARGGYYGNALQAAAVSGNGKAVQLLLDGGADVNAQGGHYGNALQAAAASGKKDVVRALLDRGAANFPLEKGSGLSSRPSRSPVAKASHTGSARPTFHRLFTSERFASSESLKTTQKVLDKVDRNLDRQRTGPSQASGGVQGAGGAAGDRNAPSSSSSLREFVLNQLQADQSEFGKARLDITAFCELRRVMKEQFAPGQVLGSVVAITGSALNAQAATCAEYMNWKWPATGLALLRAIDNALATGGGFGGGFLEVKTTILRVSAKGDSITLTARGGDIDTFADIAEGLGWICAAKRISQLSSLAFSEVIVTRGSTTGPFEIRLKPLEAIKDHGQDSCWHRLFKGGVIARGFPIRERAAGSRGLDIPFSLMTFLAAVEFPIHHRDGLILMGFSTLLVPISRLEGNSIQWHMVVSDDEDKQILASSIDDLFQWSRIDDLAELKDSRALLGWCRVAKVMLGTEGLKGMPSAECTAKEVTHRKSLSSLNGSFGTPGMSLFGFTIGGTMAIERAAVSMDRTAQPGKILLQARRDPLILYDAAERRAWLVPTLAVVLQMAHVWADQYLYDKVLPYAEATYDGGKAAYDALEFHLDDELGPEFLLKDLIAQIWTNLTRLRNKQPIRGSCVHGYDFIDVARERPEARLREQSITANWTPLTELASVVLVCDKIGDVIVADTSVDKRCIACNAVPTGRDYFTSTIQCLYDAVGLDGLRGQITKHCRWHASNEPFPECRDAAGCCIQIQQLVHGNNDRSAESNGSNGGSDNKDIGGLEAIHGQGAVVFGRKPLLTRPPQRLLLSRGRD